MLVEKVLQVPIFVIRNFRDREISERVVATLEFRHRNKNGRQPLFARSARRVDVDVGRPQTNEEVFQSVTAADVIFVAAGGGQ